jgi:T-complex protein 1 subunit eta
MMIVKSAIKNTKVVGGGGAIELEISRYLKEYSRTVSGKQQRVIERFAKALEAIPRTLVQNSGGDATDILNKLRKKHAEAGSGDDRWMGVDCINNSIKNTFQSFIWEPTVVKENALESATEACCLILSIDETIKNPQSEQPKGKPGAGKGFGKQMANMARGGKGKGMRQLQNKLA